MILAIDTSSAYPVVAVSTSDGQIRFAERGTRIRSHAEDLAPLLRQALACGPISSIAAGRGPGAFTGLRVGLVAARAIGWARGLPVVGFCSLDTIALQEGLTEGWTVVDARRGELYLAQYAAGVRVGPPRLATRDVARATIGDAAVVGDGALLTDPARKARGTVFVEPESLGAVAAVAAAADPPLPPEADYLRRPDVTLAAAAGIGGGP